MDGRAQKTIDSNPNLDTSTQRRISLQAKREYNRRGPTGRHLGVVDVRRGGLILVLLLLGGGVFASAKVGEETQQGFPLSPGTEWVYRGWVRSDDGASVIGKMTPVNWKMSVVRTVEREGVSASVVSGFPTDLDWSEGNATPALSIIVVTPDAKFYLNSEWDTQSVLDQIDNPKYPLQELAQVRDWFLQLPLAKGNKFCDEEGMRRPDDRYCWVTGAPYPADLHAVKGVSPGTRTAYEIGFDTDPDDTEIEFVGGVGITSYQYHHHGTIAETELRLIEFHSASGSSR